MTEYIYAPTLAFAGIRSNLSNYARRGEIERDESKIDDDPIMKPVCKTFDTDASAICEESLWL